MSERSGSFGRRFNGSASASRSLASCSGSPCCGTAQRRCPASGTETKPTPVFRSDCEMVGYTCVEVVLALWRRLQSSTVRFRIDSGRGQARTAPVATRPRTECADSRNIADPRPGFRLVRKLGAEAFGAPERVDHSRLRRTVGGPHGTTHRYVIPRRPRNNRPHVRYRRFVVWLECRSSLVAGEPPEFLSDVISAVFVRSWLR